MLSLLYLWSFYNIPILAAGIKQLRKTNSKKNAKTSLGTQQLPTFSIIVPAKDEEKVVNRLLNSLLKLDYPDNKKEIVVVAEDGSTDKTVKICIQYAQQYSKQIKLIRQFASNGKPSALNFALKHLKGEIVAVFDADNVIETDALLRVAEYFEDSSIGALQGRSCSINSDENMLSKFISYEEAVRYETYIKGKDVLGLFVPLTGSCYFVRRNLLDKLGGWNDISLSEDMELSARIVEEGHKIAYASDVRSWQENPSTFTQLYKQRTRWFRGCMEVSLKYGKLLTKVDRRCIDAEITLFGPYMFVLFLLSYVLSIYAFLGLIPNDIFSSVLAHGTVLLTTVTLFLIGTALFCMARPRKLTNLLWLPFVYAYWNLQSFIALHALLQIALKRPRKWVKTARTGVVSNHVV